jgi:hypothetical protein
VEQGPLVLALESPDLPPEWNVNEITADPESIHVSQGGATLDVYRRAVATEGWPYHQERHENEHERVRTRLTPYRQWANRGPATMRVWLPIATRGAAAQGSSPGEGAGENQEIKTMRPPPPSPEAVWEFSLRGSRRFQHRHFGGIRLGRLFSAG